MSDEEPTAGAVEDPRNFDRTALRACAILAIGLAFVISVANQWFHLNGNFYFTYWTWTWRDLGIFKTAGLTLPAFLLIVWVLWQARKPASPGRLWLPLALLALANYLLQILSMLADPRGLDLVRQIVSSGQATSYFVDAAAIQRPLDWLAHFQDAQLNLHAMTHPPGPILFYYFFLNLLDPPAAALIGGCTVGLLASIGAPVMYAFAGLWTEDRRTRLTASAFYALLPALSVFLPEFDQIYPIFSMLLILFWVRALDAPRDRLRYAAYAGVVLFAATFFAYNLLTVGTFLVYFGVYWLGRENWSRPAWIMLWRASATVAATCAGLYAALWLATGFHPIASFLHATANQAKLQWRPYYPFPLWDPYDFLLGSGIIALPILLLHLQRLRRRWNAHSTSAALTLIGLATIFTVDLSGLLRGETTRVWLFLQPLVVAPVALELCRFPWGWRMSMFTLQWWILACLKAKMSFINP